MTAAEKTPPETPEPAPAPQDEAPPTPPVPPAEQVLEEQHIKAAVEEEQTRLRDFMTQQQVQYLLNRSIELNAKARQADAATATAPTDA